MSLDAKLSFNFHMYSHTNIYIGYMFTFKIIYTHAKNHIYGFSHLMNDSKVFGCLPEEYLKYTNIHLSKMLVELFPSWNSYFIDDTDN